jgi:hypothetical protein
MTMFWERKYVSAIFIMYSSVITVESANEPDYIVVMV